ncbi:MAG TPA: hypothetical protein ENG50_00625 [Candidatus Altiarchaeales archaeon]|nr:hypothetical protein [Candidatus Altiarchaeales archaeon]
MSKTRLLVEFARDKNMYIMLLLNHHLNLFAKSFPKALKLFLDYFFRGARYRTEIIKSKPTQTGRWWHKDLEINATIREPGKPQP